MIIDTDHQDGSVSIKVYHANGSLHRIQIGPFDDFDQRMEVNAAHMAQLGFTPLDAAEIALVRSTRETLHSDSGVQERMSINAARIAEEMLVAAAVAAAKRTEVNGGALRDRQRAEARATIHTLIKQGKTNEALTQMMELI